jgi:predicted ATPase
VAAVLGITQQPGKTVSESVAAALDGRVRLLVFDNCEHVVDSVADLVEAILAASATVTILATSREGLGVSDEQSWRVPSLDVNSGTESAAVNLCPQCRVGLLAGPARRGGRCSGNLPQTRRHPVGHRVGGLADGVDDRQ